MIYCFDLDDTLCTPNKEATDSTTKYGKAVPIQPMIDRLNVLHAEGHKIIINTARRMLTHDGNRDKILIDVGQITIDWLASHSVCYDELIFCKPYADFYIDDKAINVKDFL